MKKMIWTVISYSLVIAALGVIACGLFLEMNCFVEWICEGITRQEYRSMMAYYRLWMALDSILILIVVWIDSKLSKKWSKR